MADFVHRLACVIGADGSIARGYMIDHCELVGVNEYVISWRVPLQNEAKTNFSCVIGSVAQEPVEPGFCTVGLMADPMKLHVHTYDIAGEPARRPFHQDSRTNCWARWREGGFSVDNALSAQCGIGIAFLSDAATRQQF